MILKNIEAPTPPTYCMQPTGSLYQQPTIRVPYCSREANVVRRLTLGSLSRERYGKSTQAFYRRPYRQVANTSTKINYWLGSYSVIPTVSYYLLPFPTLLSKGQKQSFPGALQDRMDFRSSTGTGRDETFGTGSSGRDGLVYLGLCTSFGGVRK